MAMRIRGRLIAVVAAVVLTAASPAYAISIAVFGNNAIDDFINAQFGAGSAMLVSDADLQGDLSGFDAVFITRNGASFGVGLSAAAAANVASFVGPDGNVVLLNADFADSIPGDANIAQLVANAVSFAAASGHGYIGEFNGSVMAVSANANGFTPLNLIGGVAGPLMFAGGGSAGSINLAPAGAGHPVLAGVLLPYNPPAVEFGATLAGIDPAFVLAVFDGGNPAVVARGAQQVPEPLTLSLLGLGAIGVTVRRRLLNKA